MRNTKKQYVIALLAIGLLGACGPAAPTPTPTPEPVLPMLPSPAAEATAPAATTTPVPLGQATTPADALGAPTVTPVRLEAGAGQESGVPTATCLAGAPGATRLPGQRMGVNIPPGTPIERSLDLARDMHVTWVRATLRWSDMEPQQGAYHWEQLDALAAGAQARGLNVLLVVTQAPPWAASNGGLPERPEEFGAFMGALASRARGQIAAYEIWQTPNSAATNGGTTAEPGAYVETLKAAYGAIKGADPCALVLSGALLPSASRDPKVALDDLAFYRGMLAYNSGEVARVYDILAVRLNTSGVPGKGKWPREQPAQSRGFYGHIDFIRNDMAAGDEAEKQAWVVEVGYAVDGEFAVTEQQQGEYLAELFPLSRKAYPWLSAIFARDLGDSAGDSAFSLLGPDGSPRPAYARLRDLFAKERAEQERVAPIKGTDRVLMWKFWPNNRPIGRLALGPDGAIYTLSSVATVRGVEPNGAFRLALRAGKRNVLGVAIDAGGRVYASADNGTLSAYGAGGKPLWDVLSEGAPTAGLLISRDGQTLYTGTSRERLDAYATSDGRKAWEALLGGIPGAPALGPDGTIYIGSSDGALHAITPDGKPRWSHPAGAWVSNAPIVSDTTIYAATDTGAVVALDTSGTQRWRAELGGPPAGLALGPDGTVVVSTLDGQLHALGRDGALRWSIPLEGGRLTAPAVGIDGTIYVGAEDGGFRVVTPDGRVAGIFGFQVPIRIPPLAGPDGAVYLALGDEQDYLLAFGPAELRKRYRVP